MGTAAAPSVEGLRTNYDKPLRIEHIGYEDAYRFTREYKRLFGEPPIRDLHRVRATAAPGVEL